MKAGPPTPEKVREAVDRLWGDGVAGTHASRSAIHGPSHWVRVERNGLYIARRTGANQAVVSLFALFHDSRRENDGRGTWNTVSGRLA